MISALNRLFYYGRALFSPGPNYLILFVTARCNLRCPHCFYLDQIENADKRRELSVAEFEKVARGLPHLVQLTLTGGEPFFRADLSEIVSVFYRHARTRFVTITTNGTFPDRVVDETAKIAKQCPSALIRIPLSLDAAGDRHDVLRGKPGTFAKAIETYRRLEALGFPNIRLDVTSVLTRENERDMPELVAYVRDHLKPENHTIMQARGNVRDPEKVLPSAAAFQEQVDRSAERHKVRFRFPFVSRGFLLLRGVVERAIVQVNETGKLPFPCTAGRRLIEIDEYGKLFPCETLEGLIREKKTHFPADFTDPALADLRLWDFDVKRALASSQSRRVTDFIAKGGCSCTFECALGASVAFELRQLPRLLQQSGNQPTPSPVSCAQQRS